MKKSLMRKYARLVAVVGANVQPNQPAIIHAEADQYEFVTMLTEECYKAGASYVRVDFSYQPLTRLHYDYQSLEMLSTVLPWVEERYKQQTIDHACDIYVISEDPSGLEGVDREKIQKARQATYPIIKPYRDMIDNVRQWSIVSVPSRAWAQRVFPDLKPAAAVEALWRSILASVRVDEKNDPVEAWKAHNAALRARCDWLNGLHLEELRYKSANGTDFRVRLMPESKWCGGSADTLSGVAYNPNMPTEEVFTTPMKGQCEGTLVSTKPLSENGQMIEDFRIRFENGKAVEWDARVGTQALNALLTMDEGAKMLGELALIPCDSPINHSGVLFLNTLFDENASCHVALGRGFNDCVEGYENRTDEECKALGVNDSIIHVDFMIGAPDLCITGIRGETETPIFIDGEWADMNPCRA